MDIWWIELINNRLHLEGNNSNFRIFVLVFSISCLLKFTIETYRGYFNIFNPEKYLKVRYNFGKKWINVSTIQYKYLYVFKIVAAISLMLEFEQHLSILCLSVSFFLDFKILFKFHTSLFFILAILIGITPGLEFKFSLFPYDTAFDLFFNFLVAITISFVYITTGIRKLKSKAFISGSVLKETISYLVKTEKNRKHNKNRHLRKINSLNIKLPYYKIISIISAITHIILPFILLSRYVYFGIIIGFFIHFFYTLFYPRTILHFSLAMISTYPTFISQQWI